MSRKSISFRRGRSDSAFSLVEVVMAMGIVTFALVALMGLLVGGIQINRDSTGESQAVNLLQAMVADRQAAGYANLSTNYGLLPLTNSAAPYSNNPPLYVMEDQITATNVASAARYAVSYTVFPPPTPAANTTSQQPYLVNFRVVELACAQGQWGGPCRNDSELQATMKKNSCFRGHGSTNVNSFTLVEMLVAISVFLILVFLVMEVTLEITQTATTQKRQMDSLGEGRQSLDRFGLDWSARVRRTLVPGSPLQGSSDVQATVTNDVDANGNDIIGFLTQVPSANSGANVRRLSWATYQMAPTNNATRRPTSTLQRGIS